MATDLQTTDQNRRTPWCGLSATPKLEKLVTEAAGFSHICTPDERAALVALIPGYEQALQPAPRHACRRVITKLALAYPAAKVSEEEAEARLELYADALDDIPADVLGAACAAVLRTSKFFPAPSEIRERCSGLARRQWELSKIRALIATHDRNWRPEPEPLSDEDRAAVAAIVGKVSVQPEQRDAA
ncbi:hypothetical protein [uncultured Sphingomonas sp.]|uniref:hypothetical protein n=1 Tax=uncultured Sphingomonas sp. TaxID=158754 RepID=UPI0025D9A76C|nr:hypothetical protein [uncultured Sphingomonas sp.]